MQDSTRKRFGEAVRKARKDMFLSQRELADQLEGVKLDPTAITRIETGSRDVKLGEAVELCRVLNIWLEDAVSYDEDPVTRFNGYVDILRRSLLMSRRSIVRGVIAMDMAMNVPIGEEDDRRILAAHQAGGFPELWEKVLRSTRDSWGRSDADGLYLEKAYYDEVDERIKRLAVSLPADGVLKSEREMFPDESSDGEHSDDA